jgi:hypothetical protein
VRGAKNAPREPHKFNRGDYEFLLINMSQRVAAARDKFRSQIFPPSIPFHLTLSRASHYLVTLIQIEIAPNGVPKTNQRAVSESFLRSHSEKAVI